MEFLFTRKHGFWNVKCHCVKSFSASMKITWIVLLETLVYKHFMQIHSDAVSKKQHKLCFRLHHFHLDSFNNSYFVTINMDGKNCLRFSAFFMIKPRNPDALTKRDIFQYSQKAVPVNNSSTTELITTSNRIAVQMQSSYASSWNIILDKKCFCSISHHKAGHFFGWMIKKSA